MRNKREINTTSRRSWCLAISSCIDGEDGGRIVLEAGIRLFRPTVDAMMTRSSLGDVCAGCCCANGLDVVVFVDPDALEVQIVLKLLLDGTGEH